MKKAILLITSPIRADELGALAKAHVSGYTRKDGTFVAEHEDKRTKKPAHTSASLSVLADQHESESDRHDKLATKKGTTHPDYDAHVLASAHHMKAQRHAEKARDAADGDERDAHLAEYAKAKSRAENAESKIGDGGSVGNKAGKSRQIVDAATYSGGQYEEHSKTYTDQHASRSIRVGKDKDKAHEHAEDTLKGAGMKPAGKDAVSGAHLYESDSHSGEIHHDNGTMHVSVKEKSGKAKKPAPSKPLHHSDLKEGDELVGPDGEKHEYSHTTRGLGRMKIETRAGYSHPTEKDGTLPGWKKTGRNNKTGKGH